MTKAEKIMKKKAFIKAEMDRTLPKMQSDDLWQKATDRLSDILTQNGTVPKGARIHTDNFIFPYAAIYFTVGDAVGKETAYSIIEKAAVSNTLSLGKKLRRMMKIPGMSSLFIRIWGPITKKIFGPGNGFKNVFYPKKKGEFRMDVTECPYCRYYGELGCPELTKISCENDDRMYGDLPGIIFERTGTLGKGAGRCDFCIRKKI